jgi:tRNA A58 N-methylase Trm61
MNNENDKYILATDTSAQERLRLLQSVYGPSTEALLNSIGIVPGMRAVDFGCGMGSVTQTLARLVGPNGHATGVDMSREHLATAATDASAMAE